MIQLQHLKKCASRLQKAHKKARASINSELIFLDPPKLSKYQDIVSQSFGFENFNEAQKNLKPRNSHPETPKDSISKEDEYLILDRFMGLVSEAITLNTASSDFTIGIANVALHALCDEFRRLLRVQGYTNQEMMQYCHNEYEFGCFEARAFTSMFPTICVQDVNSNGNTEIKNLIIDAKKSFETQAPMFDLDFYIAFNSDGVLSLYVLEDLQQSVQEMVFEIGDFYSDFECGLSDDWEAKLSPINTIIDRTFEYAHSLIKEYGTKSSFEDYEYGYPSLSMNILAATALCFSDEDKDTLIDLSFGGIMNSLRSIKGISYNELMPLSLAIYSLRQQVKSYRPKRVLKDTYGLSEQCEMDIILSKAETQKHDFRAWDPIFRK